MISYDSRHKHMKILSEVFLVNFCSYTELIIHLYSLQRLMNVTSSRAFNQTFLWKWRTDGQQNNDIKALFTHPRVTIRYFYGALIAFGLNVFLCAPQNSIWVCSSMNSVLWGQFISYVRIYKYIHTTILCKQHLLCMRLIVINHLTALEVVRIHYLKMSKLDHINNYNQWHIECKWCTQQCSRGSPLSCGLTTSESLS